MALGDPTHDRQADAGALELRGGMLATEGLEQVSRGGDVEADAVVAHDEVRGRALDPREAHGGSGRTPAEFQGVREKVVQEDAGE